MPTVILNAANASARGSFLKLAQLGHSKLRLTDSHPYRKSLYESLAQVGQDVQVEKEQAATRDQIEMALEGADKLVFFYNDYFSMTGSKEQWLQSAVESAKKQGVKNVVAVAPVENDFYYTEGQSLDEKRENAFQKAHDTFQGLTILRPNLVYGTENYYLKFMQQSIAAQSIPEQFKSSNFTFKPVHHDALARAIHHALDNGTSGNFSVNGRQDLTMHQIFEVLCEQQNVEAGTVKHTHELFGFADIWNEFWSGVSHDTNMRKMIEHFGEHDGLHEQDYFESQGLQHEEPTLKEVFAKAPSSGELARPLFIDYKRVSLN